MLDLVSPIESLESSSPMITRAVAAGLCELYCDNYLFPAWQRIGLKILGVFPQAVARRVIQWEQSLAGLPEEQVRGLRINQLINARLADYSNSAERFPAVVIGVGQGGATAHLALATGGPFLPQAFVLTLKGGSLSGNVQEYLSRSATLAQSIARNNPGIMTIQHYDPLHDGWLTRRVNHLRIKLLDLPLEYVDFIHRRIENGGDVIYLDGGATWLRYRLDERSVFQVGGWGDIPAEEYLECSPRVAHYAHLAGLTDLDWKVQGFPLEAGPESEWGSEPGLGEALEEFCTVEGYRFTRIHFPEPNGFSWLAYLAVQELINRSGLSPSGVVVEMFSQFDASAVIRSGLLPLWLIFNTHDSLKFLRQMVPSFPKNKPVFFSPLSTFSITPDLVSWDEWVEALSGLAWTNIGARASHYPSDAKALVEWNHLLHAWCNDHPQPIRGRLSGAELADLSSDVVNNYGTSDII